MQRPHHRPVPPLAAALTLLLIACGPQSDETEPPPHEYESALLERLAQLAGEELSEAGGEPGRYCVARIDSIPPTTSRDPSESVLEPARAEGRQLHPLSECGSFEQPVVDGEPTPLVLLLPVDAAAADTLVGGYRLTPGAERYFSCPVSGEEAGVLLGVCRAHAPGGSPGEQAPGDQPSASTDRNAAP